MYTRWMRGGMRRESRRVSGVQLSNPASSASVNAAPDATALSRTVASTGGSRGTTQRRSGSRYFLLECRRPVPSSTQDGVRVGRGWLACTASHPGLHAGNSNGASSASAGPSLLVTRPGFGGAALVAAVFVHSGCWKPLVFT
jgi:hypothetical protein